MDGPYSSNVQDPAAWEGMPAPSSAGDPDERMLEAARAAAALPRARAAAPQLFPASQRSAPTEPATETDPAKLAGLGLQREMGAGNELMANSREMQDDPAFLASQQKTTTDELNRPDVSTYKPGFGTRLLRGLRGAAGGMMEGAGKSGILGPAIGALGGAINPASTGGKAYGAPTDTYDIAMNKYNQTLAADKEQSENVAANFKRAQDLRVARDKGFNEGGEAFGRTVTGGVDLAKLPGELENQQDPGGKDREAMQTQTRRLNFANADPILSKPGYTRSRYLATGEVQPAREGTFEEQEYNRQVGQWQRANPNQKMTPDVEQSIYQSVRGKSGAGDAGDAAVSAIVADATGKKQEFINNYDHQPDGSYLRKGAAMYEMANRKAGDLLTPDQYAAKVDQFRLDANKQLAKHGAQIGADGQVVSRQAPGANPAANAPAAAAKQSPAPDGTRRQAPNGTIEVKRAGKWVPE